MSFRGKSFRPERLCKGFTCENASQEPINRIAQNGTVS